MLGFKPSKEGWWLIAGTILLLGMGVYWWWFAVLGLIAAGTMGMSLVRHVKAAPRPELPDPIAEMVTFKAKRRREEAREWADQFAALTGATVPDAYAPPDELHNRALCPCVECTVYRMQRPTAVLAAVPGAVGRMRGSIEQYRNPAYGTKPSEPMYILPSTLRSVRKY